MAEDTSSLESTSAEALMTMKESRNFPITPTKRPHPIRIRKPNSRLYFGEDDEISVTKHVQPKARHRSKATPTQLPSYEGMAMATPDSPMQPLRGINTADRRAAQNIGVRLRNLLKLPKAHKWVCYEWFYSDIDRTLFEAENDFLICLRESFPQLKTHRLARTEWCKVRRLLGKPRRCSAAFFSEERAALHRKREKVRFLQQSKDAADLDLKDLPEDIPLPLSIGTKVTARLRHPQDGLFTGVIDAVDTVNNTYRVLFDKPGLGIHAVPDIEVMSNEPSECIPLASYRTSKKRAFPGSGGSILSPLRYQLGLNSSGLLSDNDPLLGSSPLTYAQIGHVMEDGQYCGFSTKFLMLITRLSKILQQKKQKVTELKQMNTEAEQIYSQGLEYQAHFQQNYAAIVLDLEKLNTELNEHLQGVQKFASELTPEDAAGALEPVSDLQRHCDSDAAVLVDKTNCSNGRRMVGSTKSLELIKKLTSLLLQIKVFAEGDANSFEFKSIQDSLLDIRKSIDPSNLGVFQNNVEIHINHIQSGMSQMGNLHAFHATSTTSLQL